MPSKREAFLLPGPSLGPNNETAGVKNHQEVNVTILLFVLSKSIVDFGGGYIRTVQRTLSKGLFFPNTEQMQKRNICLPCQWR